MAVAIRSTSTASLSTSATTLAINKPTGAVNGDLLVCIVWQDSDGTIGSLLPPSTGGAWTQAGADITETSGSPYAKVWYRFASSEGSAYTWRVSSGSSTGIVMMALTGVNPTTPIRITPTAGTGTGTSWSAPTIGTGSTNPLAGDLLICSYAGENGSTMGHSPPAAVPSGSMVEQADLDTTWLSCATYTQILVNNGLTTARTSTASSSPVGNYRSFSMAINGTTTQFFTSDDSGDGSEALSIAATVSVAEAGTGTDSTAILRDSGISDAGTGTDAASVTQLYGVADSGTGSDSFAVEDIVYKSITDSGVGTDDFVPDIPELKESLDSGVGTDVLTIDPVANSYDTGTGTDSALIARFSDTTDSGSGSDATAVLRASDVSDSGIGSDSTAIQRQATVTDGGVGSESFEIIRFTDVLDHGVGTDITANHGPLVFDHGQGSEELGLVIIPFTQILPLRQGPVYDLVVVARVPQVNSPPAFIEVDPIEWKSLTYTNTLSQPQELQASCQVSSLTESVLQRLRNLSDLATELWLYRNGKVVFAGPIGGFQTSGEDLTINCKGLLAYLRLMIVQADLRFTGADQFTIVKSMVDQWQALDYGNFGLDTSAITASGTLRDGIYLRDELHNVGQRVEDLGKLAGGFDSEVDPATRKLQLWSPIKGIDRSTGEDAIVIDERNITSGDIMCSVAIGDLASEAYATGTATGVDGGLFSLESNLDLRARYGRSALTQTFSDVSTQATLDAYTQAMVDARGEAFIVPGPKVRVTPDADLADYAEGDTIAYELGSTLSVSGSFRIRKRTVVASSTGQEAVDLEFV